MLRVVGRFATDRSHHWRSMKIVSYPSLHVCWSPERPALFRRWGASFGRALYREGPVISVSYIRTKPGMFDKYMQYLGRPVQDQSRSAKAAGIVWTTGIYTSEPRTPADTISCWCRTRIGAQLEHLQGPFRRHSEQALGSTPINVRSSSFDRGAMRESIGSRTYQQLTLK